MIPVPGLGQRGILEEDWRRLQHLSADFVAGACQDGAWENIDAGSIYLLDQFLGYLAQRMPFLTFLPKRSPEGPVATWNSADTATHHARDSMHYRGRAFDVIVPRPYFIPAWLAAVRFAKWGGIGAYPFLPVPALHLDTRLASGDEQGRGFRVFWWQDATGIYRYLDSEADLLSFLAAGMGADPHRLPPESA